MFFKIIIPNFNSHNYIKKTIDSVLKQTFQDFALVIVDDMSTDDSINIIKSIDDKRIHLYESKEKRWNGGARNIGIDYPIKTEYTLFLDCDDWFCEKTCLEVLHDIILQADYPDCVRLPYRLLYQGQVSFIELKEDNPRDLVNSLYIAPWTKCVKSDKVVKFPENTLIEDVSQHIAQCDNIETVAVCPIGMVCWNRDNTDCISLPQNKHRFNSKRVSSVYRNIADLMDLQCTHAYCEEHKKWRIDNYKNMVKLGQEETF